VGTEKNHLDESGVQTLVGDGCVGRTVENGYGTLDLVAETGKTFWRYSSSALMRRWLLLAGLLLLVPILRGGDPVKKLKIPEKGIYLGAYLDGGDAEDKVSREAIDAYDKRVGKSQAIIAFSSFWGRQSFPRKQVDIVSGYGAIPLIYWSPWDEPYIQERGPDRFSLLRIVAGKWDDYIDRWADEAKAYGKPLLVSWGLEMNGTWFPWSGYFYGAEKKTKLFSP